MTAQASVYGRLTVDPQSHQTRTGTARSQTPEALANYSGDILPFDDFELCKKEKPP